jgi:multiple sugar transport system substrate-binding protein
MVRNTPVLALAATAGLLALSGCRHSSQEGETSGIVLRLWAMPNTSRPKEDLDAILARFKDQNPGIDVQVEILDWASALNKITTAANSGTGPDVFQLGTTYTASISETGSLLPLDGLLAQKGGDSIFVPAIRPYMQPLNADNVTSFPWFVDVRPIFYRTDVLAKAGLKPEEMFSTWDSYSAGLRKIRDAKIAIDGQRVEPLGLAGKNDWNVVHNIYPWIVGNGGGIVNNLGDSVLIDDERSIQGVLTFVKLIRDGLTPKAYLEKNTAQVSAEFDEGRIATWQETSSKLVYLERPAEMGGASSSLAAKNFATALPPAGPAGRKLFIGGSNLAIFKSSKNQEAALKLIAFLTTDPDAILDFCKASGMAPALSKVYENPYFAKDPNRKLFKELAAAGDPYPAVPYWGELETSILNTHFCNIFDIAAEVNGPYSDEAVRKEMVAAGVEARTLIAAQLKAKPAYVARLQKLRQGRK